MRKLTNSEKLALFKRRQKANAVASLELEGFTVSTTGDRKVIRQAVEPKRLVNAE